MQAEYNTEDRQTHRLALARLQGSAQSLTIGKVDITQRDTELTDRIIATKTIVVEHLHIQRFSWQFCERITYNSVWLINN